MALRRGYFSRQDRASSALRFCTTPIHQVEGKDIKKTKARMEKSLSEAMNPARTATATTHLPAFTTGIYFYNYPLSGKQRMRRIETTNRKAYNIMGFDNLDLLVKVARIQLRIERAGRPYFSTSVSLGPWPALWNL